MPNHPRRKHATTGAAIDEHVLIIDVPTVDDQVDSVHQVVVVFARIRVLDRVTERTSVPGAATGVCVEYYVSVRRMLLPGEVEADVVHAVRSTVDRQHHRVLAARIEVRRLDDPPLDLEAIDRLVLDLFDVAECHASEHVVIHVCQLGPTVRVGETERHDVGR